MAIIRWSPFQEFTDLRREMDCLFDEFFGQRTRTKTTEKKKFPAPEVYSPPVDIYEKAGKIIITVEIPGVKKEDINISFLEDTITISGERKRDEKVKGEDYYHLEQRYGSFSRTIALPVEVSPEGMKANHKDGIIEIILPQTQKGQTQRD